MTMLLLALALGMSLVAGMDSGAIASSYPPEFEVEDGILDRYEGDSTAVEIPYGMTGMDERAFGESQISVTIPASVTSIGRDAKASQEFTSVALSGSDAEKYANENDHAFSSAYTAASVTGFAENLEMAPAAGNGSPVGDYQLVSIAASGMTIRADQFAAFGQDADCFTLRIDEGGGVALTIDGARQEGTWRNDGDQYALIVGAGTLYGQYNALDTTFTLNIMDANAVRSTCVFAKSAGGSQPSPIFDSLQDNASAVRNYELFSMTLNGVTFTEDQIAILNPKLSGYSLIIDASGKFTLDENGQRTGGAWKSDGNDYTLTAGDVSRVGQYSAIDMTFSMDMVDENMDNVTFTFRKK